MLCTLAEETTESKGGHFAKLKWFSIAKITFLWRGLQFKGGHGPPISAAYGYVYDVNFVVVIWNSLLGSIQVRKEANCK